MDDDPRIPTSEAYQRFVADLVKRHEQPGVTWRPFDEYVAKHRKRVAGEGSAGG